MEQKKQQNFLVLQRVMIERVLGSYNELHAINGVVQQESVANQYDCPYAYV